MATALAALAVQMSTQRAIASEVAEALASCQDEDKAAELRARACTFLISTASLDDDLRAEALLNRGIVHQEAGDLDSAIADFTEAIRLNPEYPALYTHRADAYQEKKAFDLAMVDLTTAIRLVPDDADTYASRGDLHLRLGDRERAVSDYRAALQLEPGNEEAREGLKGLGLR